MRRAFRRHCAAGQAHTGRMPSRAACRCLQAACGAPCRIPQGEEAGPAMGEDRAAGRRAPFRTDSGVVVKDPEVLAAYLLLAPPPLELAGSWTPEERSNTCIPKSPEWQSEPQYTQSNPPRMACATTVTLSSSSLTSVWQRNPPEPTSDMSWGGHHKSTRLPSASRTCCLRWPTILRTYRPCKTHRGSPGDVEIWTVEHASRLRRARNAPHWSKTPQQPTTSPNNQPSTSRKYLAGNANPSHAEQQS